MSYTVFFILVCLGPAAVICDEFNWVPKRIPSAANQCQLMGFQGQCTPVVYSSICQQLVCAKLVNGEYRRVPSGQGAWLGTQCGQSSVCRHQFCIDIPEYKMPEYVTEDSQEVDCVA